MVIVPAELRGAGDNVDTAPSRPVNTSAPARPSLRDATPLERSPAASAGRTITIIDGTSGKRREIVLPGSAEPQKTEPQERMSETSRHGAME